MASDSNLPEYRRALAEAIAWCDRQPLTAKFAESLKPTFPSSEINTDADWKKAVPEVILKRAALLGQRPLDKPDAKDAAGRILLYIPSENLFDGAAMYASKGFYDVNNVPPWDIWVHFSGRTLAS